MPFQLSCCVRMPQLRNSLPSSVLSRFGHGTSKTLPRGFWGDVKGHNYYVRPFVLLEMRYETVLPTLALYTSVSISKKESGSELASFPKL